MKKLLLVLSLVLVIGLSACSSDKSDSKEKVIKLGIIQIVDHPSLDKARNGFLDEMKKLGWEENKNLEVIYENAQGDQANLKTIANKLAKDCDIILAIATPSAQAMASTTKDIPIIITAVTDPVGSGLAKSLEKPDTNVTGTTDAKDVDAQIELFKKLDNIKTVGLIYNASEANSKVQIDQAKEALTKKGYKFEEVTVSSTNDIKTAMSSLVKKVDAIYIPSDNTIASGMASVKQISEANKIPVIAATIDQIKDGGLVTYGIDYEKLGRQSAVIADKVLKGADTKTTPIEKSNDYELYINEDNAKVLGIDPNKLK